MFQDQKNDDQKKTHTFLQPARKTTLDGYPGTPLAMWGTSGCESTSGLCQLPGRVATWAVDDFNWYFYWYYWYFIGILCFPIGYPAIWNTFLFRHVKQIPDIILTYWDSHRSASSMVSWYSLCNFCLQIQKPHRLEFETVPPCSTRTKPMLEFWNLCADASRRSEKMVVFNPSMIPPRRRCLGREPTEANGSDLVFIAVCW